jgi:hypothetical protein
MALRFLNSGYFAGKVGIGIAAPTKTLSVEFNSSSVAVNTGEGLGGGTAGTGVLLRNSNTTVGTFANLDFRANNVDARIAVTHNATNNGDFHFILDNTAATPLTRLFIEGETGNVGIGTTEPSQKLTIRDDSAATYSTGDASTNTGDLVLQNNDETDGNFNRISFQSNSDNNQTGDLLDAARITAIYPDHAGGNPSGELAFETKADAGGMAEAMRIDRDGNVGIGTTNPTTPLQVAGIAQIVTGSDNAFYGGNYVRVFGDQNYGFRNTGGTYIANISMSGNSYFNGGNVGIGTTSPSSKLYISDTSAPASGDIITNKIYSVGNVAANGNTRTGLDVETNRGGWYNSDATSGNFKISSDNRIGNSDLIGVKSLATVDVDNVYSNVPASGSLTAFYGKVSTTFTAGSGPVAKAYGLRIDAPEVAVNSEIGTYYGAYIDGASALGTLTNKYAFVTEATAGNVGIGTTSPTAAKLVVDSNTAPQILVKNSGGGNAQILFEDNSGGTQNASITYDQGGDNTLSIATEYDSPNDLNQIKLVPGGEVAMTLSGGDDSTGTNGIITFNGYVGTRQTGTPTYILGTDNSGNVVKVLGGDIPGAGGTVTGTGSVNQVAFWDGTSSLSGDNSLYWDPTNEHLGIGDSTPGSKLKVLSGINETSICTVDISHIRNDADVATNAVRIDMDLSGADTTTADRTNSGLFLDLDSSADGDASNEHRIRGISSDVRFTGFSDSVQSGYFLAESNNNTEKTALLIGLQAQASHDSNSTNGGVSNMYGVYGISSIQDLGDVDNSFGGLFATIITAARGAANVGVTKGVEGKVTIDKAETITYGAMTAVSGIIDNNEGTFPTFGAQYLFKGDYQGTKGDNAYGIYTEGNRHYFDGNIGIGTTNATSRLTVQENGITAKIATVTIGDTTVGASLTLRGGSPTIYFDRTGTDPENKILMDSAGLEFKTGTLDAEGDVDFKITANGDLQLSKGAKISNQENTDIDSAAAEVVAEVAISYTAAFFDFVVKKGTNIRSGTVYACHDGTNVEFTETSTNDLGDTSDVTLSVDKTSTNLRLIATVTSDDWSVKSLIRAI